MPKKSEKIYQPWRKTCKLRPEIKKGALKMSDFAVDLHKIVHGYEGERPAFCDPAHFFGTTYATGNMRNFAKRVLSRLAEKEGGEAILNISQTFGGGKSHTLASLYYLATLGNKLPTGENSVQSFLAEAQLKTPPEAQVAAVSFDKVSWKTGVELKGPDGSTRELRMPWNQIAWQLLGQEGLDLIDRDETQADYDTPPTDLEWGKLFSKVEESGKGALILVDEFLMWAHDAATVDPTGTSKGRGSFWIERLKNFWQRLSQAVESSKRSCLVVSLLATDPAKMDTVGKDVMRSCNNGLNRQASRQTPVEKEDLAKLLRRRLFANVPESDEKREAYVLGFWERLKGVDSVRASQAGALGRFTRDYPFHPDLLERLYGKWSDLDAFQRTRGILQVFATALSEAETFDESPIIAPQVFLRKPGEEGISKALEQLAEIAQWSNDQNPPWPNNLRTDLPRAKQAQTQEAATLTAREVEAACVTAFLYSQPIGEQADVSDIRWLVGAACEFPTVLNTGLIAYTGVSWYLEECDVTDAADVARFWRMGPTPNLRQVQDQYKKETIKRAKNEFDDIARGLKGGFYEPFVDAGVTVYKLPSHPGSVDDNGKFGLVVLGASYATAPGEKLERATTSFIEQGKSAGTQRKFKNIIVAVAPSRAGFNEAEQKIADHLAWIEVSKSKDFSDFKSDQQYTVNKRIRESKGEAQSAVRNSFELVFHLNEDGKVVSQKVNAGNPDGLLNELLNTKPLRLFNEKIDPDSIMPGGPYANWVAGQPYQPVEDIYKIFGRNPAMPKLLSSKVVLNTIELAVQKGILALKYITPADGSELWFWKAEITVSDWEKHSEVWIPQDAELGSLNASAILPASLGGLWPEGENEAVKVSDLCHWFDGKHTFQEKLDEDYTIDRPIPKANHAAVHKAVGRAVEDSKLWLVIGEESIFGQEPTALQLDANAELRRPPSPLAPFDLLPANVPDAWNQNSTTGEQLYAELRHVKGLPWPKRMFLEALNAGIAQGFYARTEGAGEFHDYDSAATSKIRIDSTTKKAPPRPTTSPIESSFDGFETPEVELEIHELQDLEESIDKLNSLLSGCKMRVVVKLRASSEAAEKSSEVSKLLEKIKKGWSRADSS
ncbi:MAG: DUF499 domain-containing protein [Opitutales bacterium]